MERGLLEKNLILGKQSGYIIGLERTSGAENRFVSHIYKGTFNDPEKPMCSKGWNRDNGTSFSIWRNNLGLAICRTCSNNTLKEINQ